MSFLFSLFILLLPTIASAAFQWEPGTQLPVAPGGYALGESFDSFIQYVYAWLLGAGGLFAFIRLILAGITWGGAGGNITKVQDAQNIIKNVVGGLAILLFSWLLLNTINPDIVNPDIRFPGESMVIQGDAIYNTDPSQDIPPTTAASLLGGQWFQNIFKPKIVDIQQNKIKRFEWSRWTINVLDRRTRRLGGGPGSGGRGPIGPIENCDEITQDMTWAEAGIDCNNTYGNSCNSCDVVWPAALVKDICTLKKSGVSFSITAGSDTGYSHRERRAVDFTPSSPADWDQAMGILSTFQGECGQELYGPSTYENMCYCVEYCVIGNFDCACGNPGASCNTCGPSGLACSHDSHIHYSIKRSCSNGDHC